MVEQNHLHIYRRIPERPDYYQCEHPDCTHFTHKIYLRNRRARCYLCQEPFIIIPKLLGYGRVARLRCSLCRKDKIRSKGKVTTLIEKRLKEMMK